MSTFTDDFERPDGGLGNNWQVVGGSCSIVSGVATATSYVQCYQTTINASGRQEAIGTVTIATANDLAAALIVKWNPAAGDYYMVKGGGTLAAPSYGLVKCTGGSWSYPYTVSGSSLSAGTHTYRLIYDSGILRFWVDGYLIMTYADSSHGANTCAGFGAWSTGCKFQSYTFLGDETVTLDVSPSPIGNFGNSTTITLTGVQTSWTPGTPGSPTFTVDHGTLSNQEILSATSATATYTPGTFLGIATFADPSTGATKQVTVTSDTTVVFPPSGAGGLSEAVIGWLDAQAGHGGLVIADNDNLGGDFEGVVIKDAFHELLVGKRVSVGTDPLPDYVSAVLADLYARLWGGEEWQEASFAGSGTNAVKTDLLSLLTILNLAKSGGSYEVGSLARELSGFPGGSHQDILTAIAAIPTGDNQDVLDAIAALAGDPLATVKAVLDLVYQIGTTSNYTLADVSSWVQAARGTDLPTIRSVLDKLGTSGNTIEARIDALSDLIVTETTLQSIIDLAVGVIAGAEGATIKGVLDAIDDLAAQLPAAATPTAPVWPGLSGVTLGTEVALADGLIVDGPMHGVLLTITGHPVRTVSYDFGDVTSWSRVGQIIFGSDRNDYERSQTFSLDTQIMVPMTMAEAESAIVRLNEGWTGTIRPWTRTA